MRTNLMILLLMSSINLIGCSSMSGNVVPQNGITMEQTYDNMELTDIQIKPPKSIRNNSIKIQNTSFHKLSNPELKMYVYPHLAGDEEIPIPGYYTAFNAYTKDYHSLPYEII